MNIVKTDDTKQKAFSMLIYAGSGFGKTTTIATLPEGKTLILDIEGGTTSINNKSHDVVNVTSISTLKEVYEGLRSGNLKYKFVVIDSISELEKMFQFERKNVNGKTFSSLKEYGEMSELMREYIRKFRDLKNKGINVLFTALEMLVEVHSNAGIHTKRVPQVGRKFFEELCGLMDMVARLMIKTETDERFLVFHGNDDYHAKTRISGVEKSELPDLTTLFRKIYSSGKKQPKKADAQTQELSKTTSGHTDGVTKHTVWDALVHMCGDDNEKAGNILNNYAGKTNIQDVPDDQIPRIWNMIKPEYEDYCKRNQ
jgi:phage nucleotide-binding protein